MLLRFHENKPEKVGTFLTNSFIQEPLRSIRHADQLPEKAMHGG